MATTIIDDLKWRYATKKFDENKKLSENKLNVLKEAFDLTATSYGLQPVKLLVVSDTETIQQLVPMSYNQPQIGNASHILVLCTETVVDTKFIKNYFDLVEKARNTPRDILKSFEDYLIDEYSKKSPEEIEDQKKLGSQNTDLDWFKNLSYKEQSKYIGRGHLLGDEQFEYLWQFKSDKGGLNLLSQYVDTGQAIPEAQFNILTGE